MEEKHLIEKVVQYFTEELGYPRSNIKTNAYLHYGHGNEPVFDIVVYVFGKPKLVVEVKNLTKTSLPNVKKQIERYADKYAIPYYVVTNGTEYFFYKSKGKETLSVPLTYEKLKSEIHLEHQEILDFLEKQREETPDLTYKLRTTNKSRRLDKGYWFLGNDNYLLISFWDGNDWKNKTPNIYLSFLPSGKVSLVFSSKDSEIKGAFLEHLATVLTGFQQSKSKGVPINRWEKVLPNSTDKDFLQVLKKFIQTDKKIIDTFISNELELKKKGLDGLKFISQDEFKSNLGKIMASKALNDIDIQKPERINRADNIIVLKSIKLQNISHFRKLEINLNYRIICLLGENGIGKSTILRAILLGLTGVNETSEIDVQDNKIQQLLRITGEREGVPIFTPEGHIILEYQLGELYTNRINFEKTESDHIVKIYDNSDESENSFGATKSGDFFQHLVIGFSQVQSREEELESKEKTLSLIKKAHVKDILPLLYDREDNRFQQLADWIIRLHAESLNNLETENERKIIAFVFEVVSAVIGEKVAFEKVHHYDKLLWVQVNESEPIPFHLISQGFKNVFAWIGHFMKRLAESNNFDADFMNKPAILLIDEIDTYLHPKWQKNILKVLAEKFPATRIITTTHSPLVVNYLSAETNAALYIIKENGAIQVSPISGREIDSIFYDWMGIKRRPAVIQKEIDVLFEAIESEDLIKAKPLFEKLKRQIGAEDSDLVEAKTVMDLLGK